jgi:hypothetical protein
VNFALADRFGKAELSDLDTYCEPCRRGRTEKALPTRSDFDTVTDRRVRVSVRRRVGVIQTPDGQRHGLGARVPGALLMPPLGGHGLWLHHASHHRRARVPAWRAWSARSLGPTRVGPVMAATGHELPIGPDVWQVALRAGMPIGMAGSMP